MVVVKEQGGKYWRLWLADRAGGLVLPFTTLHSMPRPVLLLSCRLYLSRTSREPGSASHRLADVHCTPTSIQVLVDRYARRWPHRPTTLYLCHIRVTKDATLWLRQPVSARMRLGRCISTNMVSRHSSASMAGTPSPSTRPVHHGSGAHHNSRNCFGELKAQRTSSIRQGHKYVPRASRRTVACSAVSGRTCKSDEEDAMKHSARRFRATPRSIESPLTHP
ncbi:hypothetical protein K466DRAFT_364144 [Polyporus arcularius HHB13444]|uniref:Uncharacterized protein n=1 Tax=Polyporus arcularius HHB13444 TaxID=1314778 RepID=A0A5C3NU52_9APHY|nr:hypothetical protein K466DRAFT_364144 [Polyporus arcularius HHB13444]